MKKVKIAELKAHLSSHLKRVRHGEEILVLDRDQPIAKVVPLDKDDSGLAILKKHRSKGKLSKLKFKPLERSLDAVQLIREDRDDRDDRLYRNLLPAETPPR